MPPWHSKREAFLKSRVHPLSEHKNKLTAFTLCRKENAMLSDSNDPKRCGIFIAAWKVWSWRTAVCLWGEFRDILMLMQRKAAQGSSCRAREGSSPGGMCSFTHLEMPLAPGFANFCPGAKRIRSVSAETSQDLTLRCFWMECLFPLEIIFFGSTTRKFYYTAWQHLIRDNQPQKMIICLISIVVFWN